MANLASYVGIERPAILEALGLQPDDPTPLSQLWEQFAQMAKDEEIIEIDGKTVEFVAEFPAEGNVDIAYGLTTPIESEQIPITNPVAGVAFKAFFQESPDLSLLTVGQTGTLSYTPEAFPEYTVDAEVKILSASSVLSNVISGLNSKILHVVQTINSIPVNTALYIDDSDGVVTADPSGTTYNGWYLVSSGTIGNYVLEADPNASIIKENTKGLWILNQNSIDIGFHNLLIGFTDNFVRGFYSFNETGYALEMDLTDYANQISDLNVRMGDLEPIVNNGVAGIKTNNSITATIVNNGDSITLMVGTLNVTMTETQISIGDSFVYNDVTKELTIAGYKVITEADAASSTDVTNAWNGGD